MKKYDKIDRYIDLLIAKSTPQHPFFNVSQGRRFPNNKWDYSCGCMTYALVSLYRETKHPKYFDFLKTWCDYYVLPDGSLRGFNAQHYSTDDVSQSRILFDMFEFTKDERFVAAIELSATQIPGHPRTKEGNFWHKQIYHDQVWLDGLYMLQPFYTRYETVYNNKKFYSDIINQFENVRRLMFNEDKKLYYHGYDESRTLFWADKTTGLSPHFWLRAIGWLVAAMADVAYFMEDEKKRTYLGTLLKEALDGVLQYQDQETKLFWDIVDLGGKEKNYLETSGSALIAYATLRATNLGILPSEYFKVGLDIFDGIYNYRLIEENDDINLIQINEVSGLGPENNPRRDGSYDYYMSEPIITNDAKGAGPFIMAYAEILKAKSKR